MMSNIANRAMAVYQNLPLPAGSAVGVVAVLVLERVAPLRSQGRAHSHGRRVPLRSLQGAR